MLVPNLQVYLIGAAVAVAMAVGGYLYIDSLQSRVDALQERLATAEAASKANKDALDLQAASMKDIQTLLDGLDTNNQRVDKEVATLRRRVNEVLKITNDPTTARPDAENAINTLSDATMDRIRRSMTGASSDESN